MNILLPPVLAMIVLSLVVWFVMLATRLPAVARSRLSIDDVKFPEALRMLPAGARQVADNYNHLMEQPTIFYALVFMIILAGHSDRLHAWLAWAYVAVRAIHTVVQCTVNWVPVRLPLFVVSTGFLIIMAGREVILFALHR